MKPKITELEIEEVIIKGKTKDNQKISLTMDKKTFFKWRDKLKK
jgi:hypothetical protein